MRLPQCSRLLIRSRCTEPFLNLAFEEWQVLEFFQGILTLHRLFKNGPSHQTSLLLWRNKDCVVIGRNQNPWVECNVPALKALGIPLLRRNSGGGTVFHVLGPTAHSFHPFPNRILATRFIPQ